MPITKDTLVLHKKQEQLVEDLCTKLEYCHKGEVPKLETFPRYMYGLKLTQVEHVIKSNTVIIWFYMGRMEIHWRKKDWFQFCLNVISQIKAVFYLIGLVYGLWCLTPLSTIFQIYHSGHSNVLAFICVLFYKVCYDDLFIVFDIQICFLLLEQ
jgi:hypothetical protein